VSEGGGGGFGGCRRIVWFEGAGGAPPAVRFAGKARSVFAAGAEADGATHECSVGMGGGPQGRQRRLTLLVEEPGQRLGRRRLRVVGALVQAGCREAWYRRAGRCGHEREIGG